jgi:hypothetical protein
MVITNDNEDRDLVASIPGDGFEWQLWVGLRKEAAIKKFVPNRGWTTVEQFNYDSPLSHEEFLKRWVKAKK